MFIHSSSMKKFLFKVITILIVFAIIPAIFCYYYDPFNVLHPLDMVDNGIEPNKNYIKMTYILNNPDRYDCFIFGSSRVGAIHPEKIWGYNAYNMTYSEGLPQEHLNNLKTLIKNGIKPKLIIMGVDSISYMRDPERHKNEAIRCPYEVSVESPFDFWKLYLDPAEIAESIPTIKAHTRNDEYTQIQYELGWIWSYNQTSNYDFEHATPITGPDYRLDETIEEIREMVEICKENDIELKIFTSPMYYVTYEESVNNNYYEFLRKLAEVCDYTNFSGYNDFTVDENNFLDSSHYKSEMGDDILLGVLYDNEFYNTSYQGYGYQVTKDNVEDLITILQNNNYDTVGFR